MFQNPETAAKFQIAEGFEDDRQVTLVGKFSKPVSQLSPDEAQSLIDNGVNYLRTLSPAAEAIPAIIEKKSEPENQNPDAETIN